MNREEQLQPPYQPEQWRLREDLTCFANRSVSARHRQARTTPDVRDQSRVLELLGRINYQILTGNSVYIEVNGVIYKTLFGAYWRSVFTGVEHYLLKCQPIPISIWSDASDTETLLDLPIVYSDGGWTAGGYSLSLMVALP